jgi:hypothetical protein
MRCHRSLLFLCSSFVELVVEQAGEVAWRMRHLLRLSGGGDGVGSGVFSSGGCRRLLLPIGFFDVFISLGVGLREPWVRFVFISFPTIGMEIWSLPFVGSVSSTSAFSSACLDCCTGVSASDSGAAYTVSVPPSSVARRRPTIVQRAKLWPGESCAAESCGIPKAWVLMLWRWLDSASFRPMAGEAARWRRWSGPVWIFLILQGPLCKRGGSGCNVLM